MTHLKRLLRVLSIIIFASIIGAVIFTALRQQDNGPSSSLITPSVDNNNPIVVEGDSETPMQVILTLGNYTRVGQSTTVTCTISTLFDAPGSFAQLELPSDVQIVAGTTNWQGDLVANVPVSFSATINFTQAGNKSLFCRGRYMIDASNSWGDLAAIYMNTNANSAGPDFVEAVQGRSASAGQMEAPGEGQIVPQTEAVMPAPANNGAPPPAVDPNASSRAPIPAPEGALTITGRWRFSNRNGVTDSEQMLVEIIRGDNNAHLAWCYTDADGYYSCGSFTNPGGAGVRSRIHSYVSFNGVTNDVLVTVNPDWGTAGNTDNTFIFVTPVTVFADGTRDIGAWLVPGNNVDVRAYWIVDDLIRANKYIRFQSGATGGNQEGGSSTVQWKQTSTDGTYYSRGGNIHLNGTDPLSKTVVGHEYGHNVMWNIYTTMPTSNCPSPHYVSGVSALNCAWTEGWANFLAIAANNEPVYYWDDGSSLNLETPTWPTAGWSDGDWVEGRVAGALWDMIDSNNDGDDQMSGAFGDIWHTFYTRDSTNFPDFWLDWRQLGHSNASDGPIMAMYQNTINYRSGPSNDDFANAQTVGALPYNINNLNTVNATTQGIDPNTPCGSSSTSHQSRSVWYRFQPSYTAHYDIDTIGSDYDTVLAIWTGNANALTNVACNDDTGGLQSRLTLELNGSTTYYIQVMRYGNGSGGLMDLHIKVAPPVNDLVASATTITSLPYNAIDFNYGATNTGDVTPSCGNGVGRGVWYRFTPSLNGPVTINTSGSSMDTVLSVWQGPSNNLTQIACNDDAGSVTSEIASLTLAYAESYYIQVAGYGGAQGSIHLEMHYIPAAPGFITQLTPASGAVVLVNVPMLQWVQDVNAEWYNISIADVETLQLAHERGVEPEYSYSEWVFSGDVCNGSTCTISSDTLADGNYRWWMAGWGPEGLGEYEYVDFSVNAQATTAPANILSDPRNGRPLISWDDDPAMAWVQLYIGENPDGDSYMEWLERGSDFACDGMRCAYAPAISWTAAGNPYAVWMQAWGGGELSDWIQGQDLVLPSVAPTAPSAPVANNLTDTNPTFSWTSVANTTWYLFEIEPGDGSWVYPTWHEAYALGCGDGGTCTWVDPDLESALPAGDYVIRVRAWGPGGIGAYSPDTAFAYAPSDATITSSPSRAGE